MLLYTVGVAVSVVLADGVGGDSGRFAVVVVFAGSGGVPFTDCVSFSSSCCWGGEVVPLLLLLVVVVMLLVVTLCWRSWW